MFQLQESRGFRKKIKHLEESNKKLALELEHERGKLTGLGQSNAALREHNSILETALAKREADLVQLNLQVLRPICQEQRESYVDHISCQCLNILSHSHFQGINTLGQRLKGTWPLHLDHPAIRACGHCSKFITSFYTEDT